MSTGVVDRLRTEYSELADLRNVVGRAVFGDRTGLFVFLFVLAGSMLAWRTTVTINDNYTVVNGLVALADGHLHVTDPVYGGTLDTPGMVEIDGRAYPRNVAHIVFALPFLWLVQAVTAVVDLRVAIAAGWSLLLLGTCLVGGQLSGYERESQVGGSLLALVAFGLGVALATPLPHELLALVALQLATMVAASFLAVLVYQLLARMHDRRIGLAAGLATGLASPFLFWASVPKRHVLTAAFAVASIYLFYRSREAEGPSATTFRLLAYVPGGLTAWLNAAEGMVLLLAVGLVDLLTARRTTLRTLVGILAAVLVSLVPFFVTNFLISGDPLAPPRILPDYGTGRIPNFIEVPDRGSGPPATETATPEATETATATPAEAVTSTLTETATATATEITTSTSSGDVGGSSTGGVGGVVRDFVDSLLESLTLFVFMWRGLQSILFDPEHAYRVFVRSGYVAFGSRGATGLAVNLSFLESLPFAGALVAAPIAAYRGFRTDVSSPKVATDLLVVVYGVLLTLLYVHRLPVHATLTVRYLIPVFPLAIYGVVRLPWVRAALQQDGATAAFAYAGGVLVGGQLLAAAVVLVDATPDEAIQGFALLLLGFATALAGWSLASGLGYRNTRLGAMLLGLTGAFTTNTMLLVVFYFFGLAFALPVIPG